MSKSERTKLKGRELVTRLIGISTPIGGVDWNPPDDERDKAGQVLAHLAGQQVLWDLYDKTMGPSVAQSILGVREWLSRGLKGVPRDSVLREGLQGM